MVNCKTATSDPLEIQNTTLSLKDNTFLWNTKTSILKYQRESFGSDTHKLMTNIITYKFSRIAFCPCTLPILKRKETNALGKILEY